MKHLFLTLITLTATLALTAQIPVDSIRNRLTGRFDQSRDTLFTVIDTLHSDNTTMYILRDTYNAFIRMHDAALKDSIKLRIVSATRNFYRQMAIWERKWLRYDCCDTLRCDSILQYSSMPGTSRHHWGTDIDLCSVEDSDWLKPEYQTTLLWLQKNAHTYGFYMPYTDDSTRTGYKYEPWHWSYYPISDLYTLLYTYLITYDDICGFSGSHLAPALNIIPQYVLGIAKHK